MSLGLSVMHQSAGATGPPSTATALCSFLVIVIPQDAGHLRVFEAGTQAPGAWLLAAD